METKEIENTIRKFLVEELMIEQANEFEPDDELTLDSLDQTELRVFLKEKYELDTDLEKIGAEAISSIQNIINLVSENRQLEKVDC